MTQLLTTSDLKYLELLRDHRAAPVYNWTWDSTLDEDGLALVRAFWKRCHTLEPSWEWGKPPDWVEPFAQACLGQVPFYRRYARRDGFALLPPTTRADLKESPESFIPEGVDCTEMVYHETSGTTGTSVRLLSHPVTGECYLPLLSKALASAGVALKEGPERVALALVFHHSTTLTYPQICPVLGGSAFLRLNLHPSHWRDPEHRSIYLDFCSPQVYTGTPLSLMELAKLSLDHRPEALVTTSMTLLPATRKALETHFGCPLIDLYSLAECRCVAASHDGGELAFLAHDLYVEILDSQGRLCAPGEIGEITLTGGRNPYLPLLRYRTGDFAAMHWPSPATPRLHTLEGRAPVAFRLPDGSLRNNMEATRALCDLPLTQFRLHQAADLSLSFVYRGEPSLAELVSQRLAAVFVGLPLRVESCSTSLGPKWIVYSSEVEAENPLSR